MNALPILYSFRRCPYAMRARMAIWASGSAVSLREVVLRNKPAALVEASPKATVPVLVLANGSVIEESIAIMDWALEQNDPKSWGDASPTQPRLLAPAMGVLRAGSISTNTPIVILNSRRCITASRLRGLLRIWSNA